MIMGGWFSVAIIRFAELVHRGIVYDLQVDTTHTEALPCAQAIAAHAQ